MLYPINKTLQNNILSKIPQEYSKLEKAVFIYNELCKTLEYSMDYFLDQDKWQDWFTELDNLMQIDGVNNKKVVCYTFNCIFLELLDQAHACDEVSFLINRPTAGSIILPSHSSLHLSIDDVQYDVDASLGILNNNDLVLSKYYNHQLLGWQAVQSKDQPKLNEVLQKVRAEHNNLTLLQADYIAQKGSELWEMPLRERACMFLDMALEAPEYSVLTFNYMLKLKNLLFKDEEIAKPYWQDNVSTKVDLVFVKQNLNNEYKALFFYNPDGYTDIRGCENFDSLQVYEIAPLNHKLTQMPVAELRDKIDAFYYVTRSDESLKNKTSQMLMIGRNPNSSSKYKSHATGTSKYPLEIVDEKVK